MRCSFFIRANTRFSKTRRTVHFYSQFCLWAVKIQNVLINAVLPAEFVSVQLLVFEVGPKRLLGIRHVFAKKPSLGFLGRFVECLSHENLPHPALPLERGGFIDVPQSVQLTTGCPVSSSLALFKSPPCQGGGEGRLLLIKKLDVRLLPHFGDHLLMFAQGFLFEQGVQDICFYFG